MFKKFFRELTKVDSPSVSYRQDIYNSQTVQETIQEIHDTFYSEVDRLLESALQEKSKHTEKQDLIDKCNRLKSLGFTNTKEVQEAEKEIKRLDMIEKENSNKQSLVRAINYFSFNYPHYKFITEESVKKICEKYNLIYGEIGNYIGTVPDKNLRQMEDFKIKEEDMVWQSIYRELGFGWSDRNTKNVSKEHVDMYQAPDKGFVDYHRGLYSFRKAPLEIAAPIKDFNTNNMELEDFKLSKIEIPDPVVLQPVLFENKKHYLIVTAWGIESSDELVFNQKLN